MFDYVRMGTVLIQPMHGYMRKTKTNKQTNKQWPTYLIHACIFGSSKNYNILQSGSWNGPLCGKIWRIVAGVREGMERSGCLGCGAAGNATTLYFEDKIDPGTWVPG